MLDSEKGVALHLSIHSLAVQGREREETGQELVAQLFRKGRTSYIRYEEELEGIGRVMTTLKVEEQQVTIIRHGVLRMKHVYRLGEETISQYETGEGSLIMKTKTLSLEYTPFEADQLLPTSGASFSNQGRLHLSYHLTLQDQYVGQFTLEFNLQPKTTQ